MDKNRMRYAFVIVPVLMGLVVFVVLFLAGTKSDKVADGEKCRGDTSVSGEKMYTI